MRRWFGPFASALIPARIPKVRGPKPQGGTGAEPPVSDGEPQPAAWLNKRAREIFADLIERLNDGPGASETHSELINLCAAALATVEDLSMQLDTLGTTYEHTARGVTTIKARPEYAQRNDAARNAARFLTELGLTPAARVRVKTGGAKGGRKTGFEDID